jgi:hypothetical protein
VEVEDAAGGVGTPLTDGVEQDAAARPARFGLLEGVGNRREA